MGGVPPVGAGEVLEPGRFYDDFLEGHAVTFVEVSDDARDEYFGFACWFYKRTSRHFSSSGRSRGAAGLIKLLPPLDDLQPVQLPQAAIFFRCSSGAMNDSPARPAIRETRRYTRPASAPRRDRGSSDAAPTDAATLAEGSSGGAEMIDHVTIRVSDFEASKRFYTTVLAPLGHALSWEDGERRIAEWGDFSIAADGKPLTRELHVAFSAESREQVEAFHRAAIAAGYRDNGSPGERPLYHPGYYGAFVLDPDGHNVEAVFHDRTGEEVS